MLRLTGMDLKLEQYKKGERFRARDRRRTAAGRADAALGRPRDAAARRRDRGARALDRARPRRIGAIDATRAGRDRAGPGSRPGRRADARSPSARSCRHAIARATSSGSAPRRPDARLVTVSVEGLADGPLDDVEVMLRGWLSSDAFDRLLARAPRLSLGPLGHLGRGAGADAGGPRAWARRDQRARRVQPPDRRVRR